MREKNQTKKKTHKGNAARCDGLSLCSNFQQVDFHKNELEPRAACEKGNQSKN